MSEQQKPETLSPTEKVEKEKEEEVKQIINWVDQIKDESTREKALEELSHKRESLSDLALYIWYSTGTVATLLQEIINTYQLLAPPKLTIAKSNKACSVLALFQCVAAHQETRHPFLQAQIPIFLYPFLNTLNKSKPYEYIRLTALGVIGALVKVDNPEVISYLLNTEIIPLCLRIMERGSELSKTVACFIVQRILLDDSGLKYICEKQERLNAINTVLGFMIKNKPSSRLVKHIIRSYYRLAENPEGERNGMIPNNPNGNIGVNNINININMNNGNNLNMGMPMDLNNSGNLNNNINMNPNMMMLNQMNLNNNQGYMMPQQPGDFNFQMYNDPYLNNGMYMGNQNPNNAYNNMNYYGNFQKN